MEKFPNEVLFRLFNFFNFHDLLKISIVSRKFEKFARSFFRKRYEENFPKIDYREQYKSRVNDLLKNISASGKKESLLLSEIITMHKPQKMIKYLFNCKKIIINGEGDKQQFLYDVPPNLETLELSKVTILNCPRTIKEVILKDGAFAENIPSRLDSLSLIRSNLNVGKTVACFLSLTSLNLESNNLKQIPNEIVMLSNLKTLILSHNPIKYVILGFMPHLRKLYLDDCGTLRFPRMLPPLTLISLKKNKLKYIPKTVLAIKTLKTLYLDDNKIKKISPNFFKHEHLTIVTFNNNPISFDERIYKMPTLWHVSFLGCGLQRPKRRSGKFMLF